VTGNVLVLFDAARPDLGEVRRRVARETETYRPFPRMAPAAGHLTPLGTDGSTWHTRPRM
jgi:hypothetical protein